MKNGISTLEKISAVLIAVFTLLQITACTAPTKQESNEYFSFTDDTGGTVTLAQKPQRVAVLFSSFAEIWKNAGGEIYVTVGESIERGFADSDTLLADSGAGKAINTELLLSYEPDFVICSSDIAAQSQAAKTLSPAGIPCAQFRVETFDDYLHMLKICTKITGNEQAYETYGTDAQSRINTILGSIDLTQPKKNILFIRAGSSAKSTKAKTADEHFACVMLNELGTFNIAENAPILLDGLSIEEIITQNPEIIFVTTMGDAKAAKNNMDKIISSPEWQSLDAVKTQRVYYLPKELFQYKPNARWADAYAYLAEIIYE